MRDSGLSWYFDCGCEGICETPNLLAEDMHRAVKANDSKGVEGSCFNSLRGCSPP